jgi:hypothetical protein
MRRCNGRPKPEEGALDTDGADTGPTLRVIQGMPHRDRGRPPEIRRTCRYRAATARVPAGRRVRHPACPRCGERLGYMETAGGALFLHVDDPAFRLHVVDETR